jgi:hypothetical protein
MKILLKLILLIPTFIIAVIAFFSLWLFLAMDTKAFLNCLLDRKTIDKSICTVVIFFIFKVGEVIA